MRQILSIGFLALLFVQCGGESDQAASKIDPGELYTTNCGLCHGADGKKQLADAADLSVSLMTKDERIAIITEGKGDMAPFGKMLSREQISALADYLDTLKQ